MRTFTSNRYSVVTSTLALIIALGGGTAYAAGLITSKDIKDGTVKRIDLAKNAVDSRKVADGSLSSRDFKAGQLPAGSPGPAGPAGPRGPAGQAGQAGPAGPLDILYVRTGPLNAVPGITEVYLYCPVELSPTGGGIASSGSSTELSMHGSFPFDEAMFPGADTDTIPDDGWAVQINNDAPAGTTFAAYTVCASATHIGQEYVTVSSAAVSTQEIAGGRITVKPDSRAEPRD